MGCLEAAVLGLLSHKAPSPARRRAMISQSYLLVGKVSRGNFKGGTNGHLRAASRSGTASEILDIAERLVQSRGFNGFSYADVSAELGITKAALHYHFAGKAEMGQSLITRYTDRFGDALAAIDAEDTSLPDKLLAYCDLYRGTLRGQRMCLCGMLAAEYYTLGQPMLTQ